METLGNTILQKSAMNFYCKKCDYGTCRKSSFDDHILSSKHQKCSNGNNPETNGNENLQKICNSTHLCENCKKEFKNRSGLWKHKQKCKSKEESDQENNKKSDESKNEELINYLIKENQEFKNLILEIVKKDTYNNTTNTTTNSHNKAFNLQFFLNETCKDAMNIMDFVESIKLQLSDLERVGELGYVEGISNIIIKNLKELDVSQRPVHCTDKKREIMYIKDENKWEKDEEQKKMHKVVRKVADKNARMILKYKEAHPDCGTYHSKFSDQYNKIIVEAMGGSGDNDFEKEEKIIRNVSKIITVDK
jgi:hypothetical protein